MIIIFLNHHFIYYKQPNWITREYYLLITLFLAPFVLKKHYSVSVYGFVVFMDERGLKYGSFSFTLLSHYSLGKPLQELLISVLFLNRTTSKKKEKKEATKRQKMTINHLFQSILIRTQVLKFSHTLPFSSSKSNLHSYLDLFVLFFQISTQKALRL